MSECRWCNGTGIQYVESGSSLCYDCPDCNGTGWLAECDICGGEYSGEYCEDCYAVCDNCEEITPIDEMDGDFCFVCASVLEEK